MKKIIHSFVESACGFFAKTARAGIFGNIAAGTHAGSVTMTAGADIDGANLVVKHGIQEGEILVAGASDKPFGVCTDEGEKGELLAVALPGCAESTFMCVAAGAIQAGSDLYTSANGKVSAVPSDGSYKVGVAMCSASSGGIVEVDPAGFGDRAYGVLACGIHTWDTSTTSSTMPATGVSAEDVVVASIASGAGSAKTVSAVPGEDSVVFNLDAAGTSGTTKIAYVIIRKN